MCEVNCFYTAPKPAASKAVFSGAILSFPQLQIYSCLLRSLGHSLPFCAAQHRNEEASAQLCFSFMFNFISPHKSDAKKWDSTHDSCCCVEDRKEARKTWHDSKGVRESTALAPCRAVLKFHTLQQSAWAQSRASWREDSGQLQSSHTIWV